MPVYVQTPTVTLPYPGLRPFRRDEHEIFFGREEHVDKLAEILHARHFVAVVGPSGCGKSSLVTAGLLPQLNAGHAVDIAGPWYEAIIRPGDRPFSRLAKTLVESGVLPDEDGDVSRIGFLDAELRRGPLGLIHALTGSERLSDGNLLIVVDQFEEIFRFRSEQSNQEADAFVALLLETVRQAEQQKLPIYVMLTMRSDYLGDCNQFAGLPEAISESQFLTPRPSREQRHAAIVGPASMFGGEVEPPLVNRLLNDMGDDPDQLPIMQHALMRMWSLATLGESHQHGDQHKASGPNGEDQPVTLTTDIYDDVGGWHNTLSNHADDAFKSLGPKADQRRRVAELLFRSLTQRGPNKNDVRRPVSVQEVADVAGVSTQIVKEVVNAFRRSDRCFLTPGLVAGDACNNELADDEILDISHESLIRQWDRLRQWARNEGESSADYRHLEDAARRWKSGEKGFLGSPELDVLQKRFEDEGWTPVWARRYGADFELSMHYLEESQIEKQRLDAEAEANRNELVGERVRAAHFRRNLMVVTTFTVLLAFATCTAVIMAYVANKNSEEAEAQKQLAEEQTNLAEMNAEEAEKARELAQLRLATQHHLPRGVGYCFAGEFATGISWFLKADEASDSDRVNLLSRRFISSWGEYLDSNFSHEDSFNAVAFSPDDSLAVTVDDDGNLRLWDLNSPDNEPRVLIVEAGSVASVAISSDIGSDEHWIVTGSYDNTASLWKLKSGSLSEKPVFVLDGHVGGVFAVAFSPDNRWLVTGSRDKTARRWDLNSSSPSENSVEFRGHAGDVNAIAISPDSQWFVTGSADNTARRWDLNSNAPSDNVVEFKGHAGAVTAVAISPNNKLLVTGSDDKTACLWNLASSVSAEPITSLKHINHEDIVKSAAFGPDNNLLLTASASTVRIWDVLSGLELARPLKHQPHVHAVAVAVCSDRSILTTSEDKSIRVWKLSPRHFQQIQRNPANNMDGLQGSPFAMSFNEKKGIVRVGVPNDYEASLGVSTLNVTNQEENSVEWNDDDLVLFKSCATDGEKVVALDFDGNMHVLDSKGNNLNFIYKNVARKPVNLDSEATTDYKDATAVAVSSASDLIVIAMPEGKLHFINLDGFRRDDTFNTLDNQKIDAIAIDPKDPKNPKDDLIATLNQDGTIRVFRPNTQSDDRVFEWKVRDQIKIPNYTNGTLAFGPARERGVLAICSDRTLQIWDVDTGLPLTEPIFYWDKINGLAFSPNGETPGLYVSGVDGSLGFWGINMSGEEDKDVEELITKLMSRKRMKELDIGFEKK